MNSRNMHLTGLGEYIKLVISTLDQTLGTFISRYNSLNQSSSHISYTNIQTTIPDSDKMDMYSLFTPTELAVNNTMMFLIIKIKTSNAVTAKIIYHYDMYDSGYKLTEFIKINKDNMERDIEYRIPIYADFKNQNVVLDEFLKLFNKDTPRIYDLIDTMGFIGALMTIDAENDRMLNIDNIDMAIQYHLHKDITELREKRREG